MIKMTRRVSFSAAYVACAAEEDARNKHGDVTGAPTAGRVSGHNYVVDVTVAGEINPKTGIIVNIKDIDRIVQQFVTRRFEGKLIHQQAPELGEGPVTPETLALWMVNALRDQLPTEVALTDLRVEETPLVYSTWRAKEAMTTQKDNTPKGQEALLSTRVYEFAASHRLHSPHLSDEENQELFGKCNYPNGHGHNYILEVTVAGPLDARTGRVIAPEVLDEIVHHEVVDRYDHRHFNYDIPEFKDVVPSTEAVTKMVWERLVGALPAPVRLYRVLIRETARNIFEYRGEA